MSARPLNPQLATRAPAAPAQAIDLRFVLTVLRRWWLVAIPFGLVCAAGAAAAIYFTFLPMYRANFLLQIAERRPHLIFADAHGQGRETIRGEVELMKSVLVLGPALSDPAIAQLPEIRTLEKTEGDPVAALAKKLEIKSSAGSELVEVGFVAPNPENAAKIVNGVVDAYLRQRDHFEAERSQRLIEYLERERDAHGIEIGRLRTVVRELAKQNTGTDPIQGIASDSPSMIAHPLADLMSKMTGNRVDQSVVRAQLQALEASHAAQAIQVDETEVELAVEANQDVQRLQAEIAFSQPRLEEIKTKSRLGEKDPLYLQAKSQVAQTETAFATLKEAIAKRIREDARRKEELARRKEVEALKAEMQSLAIGASVLDEEYKTQLGQSQRFSGESLELEFKKDELARAQDVFDQIAHRVLSLKTELGAMPQVVPLNRAVAPRYPVEQLPWKNLFAAAGAAFCVPFGLAFLWEFRHRKLSDAGDLESRTELAVIGEIAQLPSRSNFGPRRRRAFSRRWRLYEESVEALRTHFIVADELKDVRTIAVTSACSGEGKTSLASHLAVSIYRATGRPTLLIDGDMRSPDVHDVFEIPLGPGLVQALDRRVGTSSAIYTSESGVDVLPAGNLDCNVNRLAASGAFNEMLKDLLEEYDHIVIDTPPVLSASESVVLARAADATLLCTMRDVTRADQAKTAWSRLVGSGAKPVGVVMSNVPTSRYAYAYGDYATNLPSA